jgi:hypothetical protein
MAVREFALPSNCPAVVDPFVSALSVTYSRCLYPAGGAGPPAAGYDQAS